MVPRHAAMVCDVQLVPVLTLGPQTPDGRPVVLSESPLVYQDEEGRYYVGDRSSSEVFVYSVEGRFVGEFGRQGEGPGEFRGFQGVIDLPGDTILAVDWSLARLSTFGPDWRYVRSVATEVEFAGDMLRIGELLIVNPSRRFQRFGRSPIQAIDTGGTVVHGFGPPAVEDREHPFATLRALAPYTDDAFWAAHRDRYRIEMWGIDGRLRRVLERSIPEFPDKRNPECSTNWVPSPFLGGIQIGGGGELLVMLTMGDRKWRDGAEVVGVESGCPAFSATDYDLVHDTWIEVWDLDSGQVTARAVREERFAGFIGRGLIGHVEYHGNDVVYRIYRVEIRDGSR